MTTSLNLLPTKRSKTSNDIGPQYYKRGKIQVWDFIRDQGLDFHLGNVVKYVCRAGHKDDDIADLKKAIHYLQNELEYRQNSTSS
tara:strand:- start:937 stop:1191 length:255 start_codon:yes stop_codon:yes gene_type:complete